jgi:hypothetical protein
VILCHLFARAVPYSVHCARVDSLLIDTCPKDQ